MMHFLCTPYVCYVVLCSFVHILISARFRFYKPLMKFISVIHRSSDISVKPGGRFIFDTLVDYWNVPINSESCSKPNPG